MAWGARWGLKLGDNNGYIPIYAGLNGMGSPVGIETFLWVEYRISRLRC